MLDLGVETASLFIKLRNEISSEWCQKQLYTCTEAELWVAHQTSYLLL